MLTIREAQMAAFQADSRNAFVRGMVAKIETQFPESYRQLGPGGTLQFVENAIRKADSHHVHTQSAVATLIELMLDFGEDFHRSPDRNWAKRMLQHPTLPDDVKLDAMRDRMTAITQGRRIIQA